MNHMRRKALIGIVERLIEISFNLHDLQEDETEYRDSIPQEDRHSEAYEQTEEAIERIEYAICDIENAIEEIREVVQ